MGEQGSIIMQVIASLGATMGAFSLGTVLAWSAPAQKYLTVDSETGKCNVDFDCISDSDYAQVAAIMNIGAATVPVLTVLLFPKIGKKWTMLSLVIPFIGGWVLLIFSSQTWMFLLGRLLTGFSGGAFAIAAPSFSNEIAEPRIRGALGSLMQLMICLGILFIFAVGTVDWQIVTGICMIFPAVLGVWMIWMPRSPKFLVEKGNLTEARKALQFYRGKKNVEDELNQIQNDVDAQIGSISPLTLITNSMYLKPLLISLALMAFQQLSGINFVVSFAVQIFKDAGSEIDENLSSILIGVIQVVGTGTAILIVDRFGRKILLAISACIMCLATAALGIFFVLKETADGDGDSNLFSSSLNSTTEGTNFFVSQDTVKDLGLLPLISLMLFVAGFSIGYGPLPWVMNVELFSSEARVPASALCGSANWLFSYLVVSTVPIIQDATSASFCYFMFSAICLVSALFVIFIAPETKGKSEEDMKKYFSKNK